VLGGGFALRTRIDLSVIAIIRIVTAGAAYGQLKVPNPELIGMLTKQLSIKPEQAVSCAGALFGLAKT